MQHKNITTNNKALPCALCALASTIDVRDRKEKYCLWYGMRIPSDEVGHGSSPTRQACIKDGNYFVWKQKELTAMDALNWRVRHADWSRDRKLARLGAYIAVISLVLSAIGTWVNLFS